MATEKNILLTQKGIVVCPHAGFGKINQPHPNPSSLPFFPGGRRVCCEGSKGTISGCTWNKPDVGMMPCTLITDMEASGKGRAGIPGRKIIQIGDMGTTNGNGPPFMGNYRAKAMWHGLTEVVGETVTNPETGEVVGLGDEQGASYKFTEYIHLPPVSKVGIPNKFQVSSIKSYPPVPPLLPIEMRSIISKGTYDDDGNYIPQSVPSSEIESAVLEDPENKFSLVFQSKSINQISSGFKFRARVFPYVTSGLFFPIVIRVTIVDSPDVVIGVFIFKVV